MFRTNYETTFKKLCCEEGFTKQERKPSNRKETKVCDILSHNESFMKQTKN